MEPAMTKEEWASLSVDGDCPVSLMLDDDGRHLLYFAGMGRVEPWMNHVVAALALHGQEYGFTRGDVRILKDAWSSWANNYDARLLLPSDADSALMGSLIDRIEALLPPEDK